MDKIKTIIRKEWSEVFKNRFVLFTVAFLPLILTALPLGILYATNSLESGDAVSSDIPAQFMQFCPQELTGGECFQIYMVNQFLILFMMMPMMIPVTIAAYSIVGEKTTRSLEPLLATPITTTELLTGKSLAAVIPAIAATWAGFIVFAVGAALIVNNPLVLKALLDPMWLIAVVIVGPLMALMAVNASIMISSRVTDPRVAEQTIHGGDRSRFGALLRSNLRIIHYQQHTHPANRGHIGPGRHSVGLHGCEGVSA